MSAPAEPPRRVPPPLDSPPREIALVGLSALGDVVHMLPLVNALERAWPRARLTWVIQPVPYRLVHDHPSVDAFIVFHRRRGLAALGSFRRTGRSLRARRFDLLIDVQVYFKAGVLTALARSPVKLGYDRRRARDLNWLFTTHRIPPHPRQHVQDEYFEFLEYLGVDPEPVEWGLAPNAAERAAQRAFFDDLGRPACAVVLGTSKPEKNWAPERYARVLDVLEHDHGMRPVLVGGPSAVERRAADAVLDRTSARPVDMLGDDVRRLLWLLDGADLVISPDTGPLHIARAVDTPVIGLYGYTNPKRSGPYRKYGDLVVDGYAREPGEQYPISSAYRRRGMERVTVAAVLDRIERARAHYLQASPRPTGAGR